MSDSAIFETVSRDSDCPSRAPIIQIQPRRRAKLKLTHLILSDLEQALVSRPGRQKEVGREVEKARAASLLDCVAAEVVEQVVFHVAGLADLVKHLEQLQLHRGYEHLTELELSVGSELLRPPRHGFGLWCWWGGDGRGREGTGGDGGRGGGD